MTATLFKYEKRCGCSKCKAYIRRETRRRFKEIIKAYAELGWVPLAERK
jgi:hypothetical protein